MKIVEQTIKGWNISLQCGKITWEVIKIPVSAFTSKETGIKGADISLQLIKEKCPKQMLFSDQIKSVKGYK